MKDNLNEDLVHNDGDHESMEDELDGMELDDSLLFGDETDGDDYPEPEEETAVDGSEGDVTNKDEESTQPEVIDTTKQSGGDGDHDGDGDKPKGVEGTVKEIDGQLFIAVDSSNAEVMGKDGKHKIPYEVLERARNGATSAKDLQNRIAELEGQLKTTSSKQKLFEEQLTEAGLDPAKLPDELLSDPQAAERIKEEYPGEAGQIIAALIDKVNGQGGNQAQPEQKQEQPASANPVMTALESDGLKELNGWRNNDADRWEMALIIDNKLSDSPEFASKSVEERFAEVQRRVKATFGDPVQESVNQELAKQQQAKQPPAEQAQKPQAAIPNSPSELGSSPLDTTQSSHEALASQDAMAMESSMATMSDSQLEAFLEQAGMAFD